VRRATDGLSGLGWRRSTAVLTAALVVLLLGGGISVVTRRAAGRSPSAAEAIGAGGGADDAPATGAPDAALSALPGTTTTGPTPGVGSPSTVRPVVATTTTVVAVARKPVVVSTATTSPPAPKPKPASATYAAEMNGISLRMRIEPGVVIGGRQLVQFFVDITSSAEGCCLASLHFSDQGPNDTWPVAPAARCTSGITPTGGVVGRRFTDSGAYRVSLTARTCSPPPSLVNGEYVPTPPVTATLDACLHIDLVGTSSSSGGAATCA
jgi:hypothetical protein